MMEAMQISPINSAGSIQKLYRNYVAILETLSYIGAEPWILKIYELKWQFRISPLWDEVMFKINAEKLWKDSVKLHKTWHY